MFELLLVGSQVVLDAALLPTLLNKEAFVPKSTSLLMAGPLLGITVALFGLGIYLGSVTTGTGVILWMLVFWLRGGKR